MLHDIAQSFDSASFERLASKLELRTMETMDISVGGPKGVQTYGEAHSRPVDEQLVERADEWFGRDHCLSNAEVDQDICPFASAPGTWTTGIGVGNG